MSTTPFSARNRTETNWIEDDFPASARVGLLHLLSDLVDRGHLSSWVVTAKEIRRIARETPRTYDPHLIEEIRKARADTEAYLDFLGWQRVYDFCERLWSHLAQGAARHLEGDDIVITRVESQAFVSDELNRLFHEESLGYEFRDGIVQRRGKRHTLHQISKAQEVLAEQRLQSARQHFAKSLRYFRDRRNPDLENAVKDAICAAEAAAKDLFPDAKAATLGDFVTWATNDKRLLLPKTIGKTFDGLYAFRGSGEGVAHGAAKGGAVTAEIAEYVLAVAASQIILLADLAQGVEEPPF